MAPDLAEFTTPSVETLERFMAALEEARAARSTSEWRTFARNSRIVRGWRYFLALDPYTRWGLVKPRGHAGDARLMDFAYQHPSTLAEIATSGPTGAIINAYTANAAQSKSARDRLEVVQGLLQDQAVGPPMRVISFAAGHAREFEGLSASAVSHIEEFIPIDNDPDALEVAQRSARAVNCKPLRRNVVIDELPALAPAGVVYSLGLFDYLLYEVAVNVLHKMLSLTAPGGSCVLANLSNDAANLGYCEAIMDWWMVTRSEDDMVSLAKSAAARAGVDVETRVERRGCFIYLTLKPASRQSAVDVTACEFARETGSAHAN